MNKFLFDFKDLSNNHDGYNTCMDYKIWMLSFNLYLVCVGFSINNLLIIVVLPSMVLFFFLFSQYFSLIGCVSCDIDVCVFIRKVQSHHIRYKSHIFSEKTKKRTKNCHIYKLGWHKHIKLNCIKWRDLCVVLFCPWFSAPKSMAH